MTPAASPPSDGPARDCPACPRLVEFRLKNRADHDGWHNAPVPSFGPLSARLLVVGLAPGLKGANRTGRPFTGDYAGDLLYPTLADFGWTTGTYDSRPDDGLTMTDCRITNAVRCVPPENKPTGPEINACGPFLEAEIAAMANLRAILALGSVAHGAVLASLGVRKSAYRFGHGAVHEPRPGLWLVDSYHCSRYNTNTRRLTPEMFADAFRLVDGLLA